VPGPEPPHQYLVVYEPVQALQVLEEVEEPGEVQVVDPYWEQPLE